MRHQRRSVSGLSLVAVLAALMAFQPALAGSGTPGPHAKCASCHASGGAQLDASTCLGCHAETLMPDPAVASYGASERLFVGHVSIDGKTRRAVAPGSGRELARFDCLTCHDPHPNGRASQLRAPAEIAHAVNGAPGIDETSAFCAACHSSFMKFAGSGGHYTRHPIGVTVARNARTDRTPFPAILTDVAGTVSRDDDVVGCMSCHEVHRSRNPYLLRWSEEEQGQACSGCHRFGGDRSSRNHLSASLR